MADTSRALKRISVIYEDNEVLVINKPAGLAVQGGKGVKTSLDNLLAEHFSPRPLLVHRLDKETSGLILTAKSESAARFFSEAISRGHIQKRYLVLCSAKNTETVIPDECVITTELCYKGLAKKAVTKLKAAARSENGLFFAFEPELRTGRMHQIRRHLALSGFPVLGDDIYGDFAVNKELRKNIGLKRMMLHAASLTAPLPSGGTLDVKAPLPDYFESICSVLFGASLRNPL